MVTQLGKITENLHFAKLTWICFNEKSLGEKDMLLKLAIENAEFMDYKDLLRKPEDKEETNKDSVYVLESLYWRKKILKRLNI